MSVEAPVVLFRCEASNEIGSGHVMRCISLANGLYHRGVTAVFATNAGGASLVKRFGFVPYSTEFVEESEDELEAINRIARSYEIDYWVWDTYRMTMALENNISQMWPTMVIDDNMLLEHYTCQVILNQNLYAASLAYNYEPNQTKCLLGPKYALLRNDFSVYSTRSRVISEVAKKVLLTFGGSDPDDDTLKYLKLIVAFSEFPLEITIVLGAQYEYKARMYEYVNKISEHQIQIIENTTEMASLLWLQDLVLTASGSTIYELLCLGTPSCCIVTADNQRLIAQELSKHRMALVLGKVGALQHEAWMSNVSTLLHDAAQRRLYSEAGRQWVDGKGADRVADFICSQIQSRGIVI